MSDNSLAHYGVKGMKWGQRREKRQLRKAQRKYDWNVARNMHEPWNAAAEHANKVIIPRINKKYKDVDFTQLDKPEIKRKYDAYLKEHQDAFDEVYKTKIKEIFGERPGDGEYWK